MTNKLPTTNTLPPTHKQITLGWTPYGPHYAIVEIATGKVTGGCCTIEEMLAVEAAEKKLSSVATPPVSS